ncbi:hypothetical protein ACQP1U_13965 [Actinomycetota bacterium]
MASRPLSHQTAAGAMAAALALLTLSACGADADKAGDGTTAPGSATVTATTVTATTAAPPSSGTNTAAYPIVVTRTGGAGADKVTVLGPDGRARAADGECTIPPELVRLLGEALGQAPVGIPATTSPGSGGQVVTLSTQGRWVMLWQTSLSDTEQEEVSALLDNLRRPPQERTLCTQQRP